METDFINAAIGGALIAISVIMMMGLLGRITGISGILWQAVLPQKQNSAGWWRYFFLAGLITGPVVIHFLLDWDYPASPEAASVLTIISGLLVGFGTKLGSGCTSGHGICGIGRLSSRSIIATVMFMISGILTVALMHLF